MPAKRKLSMMTEEYDDQEGRRVWLSRDEVDALLEVVDDPLRKVAFRLAAECGLRTHEIVEVTPDHVVDGGEAGQMLVVPEGKGEKYREAPIPDSLADLIDAAASFGGVDGDEVLVDGFLDAVPELRVLLPVSRKVVAAVGDIADAGPRDAVDRRLVARVTVLVLDGPDVGLEEGTGASVEPREVLSAAHGWHSPWSRAAHSWSSSVIGSPQNSQMSASGSLTELTQTTPKRTEYFGDGEGSAESLGELHILRYFLRPTRGLNVGERSALRCENEAFARRPDRSGLAGI